MVWAPGHKLQNGKYVIGEILGQGGFGITYKAWNTQTNEYVVIKTPNEFLKHDPDYDEYVRKFKREAEMLKRFSANPHPYIVCIRNFFQEEDNYCLVMDFVDGETLFEVVRRRGRIPEKEAIKYIKQIGSALGDLHKAGAVHRDAHPANIMIENGKAILIDFGIAKDLTPNTLTSTGNVGNRGFAPYEQLIGGSRKPNVDVYCLAATLYFILTGKRPTSSLDRKLNNTRLVLPREIIPSISKKVDKAILKGMALESKDRPNTMEKWLAMFAKPPKAPSPLPKPQSSKTVDAVFAKSAKPSTQETKNGKEIPWIFLIFSAIIYAITSFAIASVTSNIYILLSIYGALAGAWTLVGAWFWAWTEILHQHQKAQKNRFSEAETLLDSLGFGEKLSVQHQVQDLSWTLALDWAGALAEEGEFQSLSRRDRFLILSLTSSLGIGLGWLTWYLFPLSNL